MVMLACIGLFFIVLSGIINAFELKKFFRALSVLNQHSESMLDKIKYPFRLIAISKYLLPLLPDVILMAGAGSIGLGGGVLGSIIAVGGTCMVTLIIKIALKAAKKSVHKGPSYNEAIAQIQ